MPNLHPSSMKHSHPFSRTLTGALLMAVVVTLGTSACARQADGEAAQQPPPRPDTELATAIFAGGCFWCMEPPYDKLDGVVSTTSGYTGGDVENPSYKQVSSGQTGHTEAVQIKFNPDKVSYDKLLSVFWHNIDPTDAGGQFCDRGSQYRSEIFYVDDHQKKLAEASKKRLQNSDTAPSPITTDITAAGAFYPAEDYHQNYYQTTPIRYKFYRSACGRDARLEELWGDAAGGQG